MHSAATASSRPPRNSGGPSPMICWRTADWQPSAPTTRRAVSGAWPPWKCRVTWEPSALSSRRSNAACWRSTPGGRQPASAAWAGREWVGGNLTGANNRAANASAMAAAATPVQRRSVRRRARRACSECQGQVLRGPPRSRMYSTGLSAPVSRMRCSPSLVRYLHGRGWREAAVVACCRADQGRPAGVGLLPRLAKAAGWAAGTGSACSARSVSLPGRQPRLQSPWGQSSASTACAMEGSMASSAAMPFGCTSSPAPRGRSVERSNTATRRSGLNAGSKGKGAGVGVWGRDGERMDAAAAAPPAPRRAWW